MSDRPILSSGPMVRALLDSRKTQTRRILKPQPEANMDGWDWRWTPPGYPKRHLERYWWADGSSPGSSIAFHLRIRRGDRLWVREAWTARMTHGWTIADARSRMYREEILYAADGDESIDGWWPSIHMPREFSRLTLTVTDVRVQRLNEISEEDAFAEGVEPGFGGGPIIEDYLCLWNSIHGPFAADANPWVAAYTFTVERSNIDARAPT